MTSVVLLYNKSNTFGIRKDVEMIRSALGGQGYTFKEADPLEPPTAADIAIHLEVPSYVWMPWAQRNVLVVNPEWYVSSAWDAYLPKFDAIWCKDKVTAAEFLEKGVEAERVAVTGWAALPPPRPKKGQPIITPAKEFVWFLAASRNKRAMVPAVVAAWRESYPRLTIFTTTPLECEVPEHIQVMVTDLSPAERASVAKGYAWHLAISRAEGFGYTAAEAIAAGAFLVVNNLPCYQAAYELLDGVAFVETPLQKKDIALCVDLSGAVFDFEPAVRAAAAWSGPRKMMSAWDTFEEVLQIQMRKLTNYKKGRVHLPPALSPEDAPAISIVTLLYNRRKFFDLACHNIMISDYPKDKIEWIIVEDSDDPAEDASDRVIAVAEKSAPLKMVYVPLKKRTPVAAKRNIGVERATAEIILMMDDDDHYPETSLRRRVAWLTRHPWSPQAVACTTIACYDLNRGISAVNTPPYGLPLGQRLSEATLAFYKSWWQSVRFESTVQVGEGESIVAGREQDVLEMPPQQIIVAFSHGKNTSHRRIPSSEDVKPGCFWGFPPQFLQFIHGLAGVKVIHDTTS
jgi:Glycosyl transferase family 2